MLINLLNWTFPDRMERWWFWWWGGAAYLSGVTPQPAELILIPVGNYTFKLYPEVKSCSHLINLNTTWRAWKSTCLVLDKKTVVQRSHDKLSQSHCERYLLVAQIVTVSSFSLFGSVSFVCAGVWFWSNGGSDAIMTFVFASLLSASQISTSCIFFVCFSNLKQFRLTTFSSFQLKQTQTQSLVSVSAESLSRLDSASHLHLSLPDPSKILHSNLLLETYSPNEGDMGPKRRIFFFRNDCWCFFPMW